MDLWPQEHLDLRKNENHQGFHEEEKNKFQKIQTGHDFHFMLRFRTNQIRTNYLRVELNDLSGERSCLYYKYPIYSSRSCPGPYCGSRYRPSKVFQQTGLINAVGKMNSVTPCLLYNNLHHFKQTCWNLANRMHVNAVYLKKRKKKKWGASLGTWTFIDYLSYRLYSENKMFKDGWQTD